MSDIDIECCVTALDFVFYCCIIHVGECPQWICGLVLGLLGWVINIGWQGTSRTG